MACVPPVRRAASLVAFLLSMVLILMQAAAFWSKCGPTGSVFFRHRLPIFLIVHLGTAVPERPLTSAAINFHSARADIVRYRETVRRRIFDIRVVVLTAPLWILGFAALVSSGFTLSALGTRSLDFPLKQCRLLSECSR